MKERDTDPEQVDSLRVLEMRDKAATAPAVLSAAGAMMLAEGNGFDAICGMAGAVIAPGADTTPAGGTDCAKARAASTVQIDSCVDRPWPDCSVGYVEADECPAMAYRYIGDDGEIPTTTIDQIVTSTKRPPDAITVDVEGFEIAVMRGAEMTLLKHRPLVWISVHPDLMERAGWPDVQELFDFMTGLGYGREYLGTDHEQHHLFVPLERTL